MAEYRVTYIGTVREVYVVDAESEADARARWAEFEPTSSEVIEGEVVRVELEEMPMLNDGEHAEVRYFTDWEPTTGEPA